MSEVSMFNLAQEREDNRAIGVREYLAVKKKDYEDYLPFNRVVQALLGNIARLDPLRPEKDQKGTVITKSKKDLKTSLAVNVNIVCVGATDYALSIGDSALKQAVRFRASDIKGAKDGNVTGIVSAITDALTPLLEVPLFQEYQITADMLTALTKDAEDFASKRGKAAVVDNESSEANDEINLIFKDIRDNIASLRRMLVHFTLSNPAFVKGFKKAAAIDETGIHHSGVEVVLQDKNDVVIHTATVTLTRKDVVKPATVSEEGEYKIIKCVPGNWQLSIVTPGYETQTVAVKITRGKIQKLSFTLQSAVMAMPGIHTA